MTDTRIPERVVDRLHHQRVVLGDLLQDNGKSLVYAATYRGEPAVVKLLTSVEPQWVQRHRVEQQVYQTAAAEGCPLRLAGLRYHDDTITILDRLPGTPLSTHRYPGPLPPASIHAVLDYLEPLYAWDPAGLPQVPVTQAYVERHQQDGWLSPADVSAIRILNARQRLRPEHGDTHAHNVLLDTATVTVVDLEHTARHLPGHDWALMWLLWGPGNPWLRPHLINRAEQHRIDGAFAVNLALLACREVTIHDPAHTDPTLNELLADNLRRAREHLQTIHSLSW